MATDTTTPTIGPTPEFSDFIKGVNFNKGSVGLQQWMKNVVIAATTGTLSRDWCTLDCNNLTELGLAQYFDRIGLGDVYVEEYNIGGMSRPPFAFIQRESDLIFSMHRCFATRYRGRVMSYRDDCSQKKYHTYSAISQGVAKYNNCLTAAKKSAQQPANTTLET